MEHPLRQKFMNDLEVIFERALEAKELRLALKAKELLGKMLGFLRPPQSPKVCLQKPEMKSQEALSLPRPRNREERRLLERMQQRA